MKRKVGLSVGFGLLIAAALTFASTLFTRFFPYGDKPMMPKPFFLAALAPGYIVVESVHIRPPWVQLIVFFGANALTYSIAFFLVSRIVADWTRRRTN